MDDRREVTVRLDDLRSALDAARSNPYLFDGEESTDWLPRLRAIAEPATCDRCGIAIPYGQHVTTRKGAKYDGQYDQECWRSLASNAEQRAGESPS